MTELLCDALQSEWGAETLERRLNPKSYEIVLHYDLFLLAPGLRNGPLEPPKTLVNSVYTTGSRTGVSTSVRLPTWIALRTRSSERRPLPALQPAETHRNEFRGEKRVGWEPDWSLLLPRFAITMFGGCSRRGVACLSR